MSAMEATACIASEVLAGTPAVGPTGLVSSSGSGVHRRLCASARARQSPGSHRTRRILHEPDGAQQRDGGDGGAGRRKILRIVTTIQSIISSVSQQTNHP